MFFHFQSTVEACLHILMPHAAYAASLHFAIALDVTVHHVFAAKQQSDAEQNDRNCYNYQDKYHLFEHFLLYSQRIRKRSSHYYKVQR